MCLECEKRVIQIYEIPISKTVDFNSLVKKGIYLLKSKQQNLLERTKSFFNHLSLLENNAHLIDEIFHFTKPLFKQYAPINIYQKARDLHHAAHSIDHFLHGFHFFHDVTILAIDVITYTPAVEELPCKKGCHTNKITKVDYDFILRSAGRTCLLVSHFFETATFLSELKYSIEPLQPFLKYAPLLSFSGYTLLLISALWKRTQNQKKPYKF